ncbi:DUF3662 and FHA domain-containing protein [Corynebacterium oculi]|uniref:FHA domain-containing protein FhaA n=1 Tax=Corynebacterium oculi TaxID=1544416 RepID=A0A0Q1AD89_9CORY|nr:DUF3662 and FHA domain-containing protein [Corynebacterium oculi]KQB84628.1 FHA domain-containing protein FhaA [Corynebacterium oculi]
MSIMARFAKFDSAMQRGLDNGFALVFGGSVVPAEIEELLKQEIQDNVEVVEGRPEAPNVFLVGLSKNDVRNLAQQSASLPEDFADRMGRYCRNQGLALSGTVVVRIAEESGMRTGQLRVSSYTDPHPDQSSGFDWIGTPAQKTNAPKNNQGPTQAKEREQMSHPQPGQAARDAATEFIPRQQAEQPPRQMSQPDRPTVSLLLQDGSSRTYLVQEGSNILGRSHDADFRLPDTGVSRQHAEVTWDGQDAVLVDLQSTNGTTVNDTPVDNWLLADGDIITIGHSHIEVRVIWPQN